MAGSARGASAREKNITNLDPLKRAGLSAQVPVLIILIVYSLFKCRCGCLSASLGVLSPGFGIYMLFFFLRKLKEKEKKKGSPSCALNNTKP